MIFLLHSGLWQTAMDWGLAGSAIRPASALEMLEPGANETYREAAHCGSDHSRHDLPPTPWLIQCCWSIWPFFFYDTSFVLNFGGKCNAADSSHVQIGASMASSLFPGGLSLSSEDGGGCFVSLWLSLPGSNASPIRCQQHCDNRDQCLQT